MRASGLDRHIRVMVALLCLAAALGVLPSGVSALATPTELALGSAPATDGAAVVWSGSLNWDSDSIYALRLDDRQIVPVAQDATADTHTWRSWPDVSGDIVVWMEEPFCCP